MQSANTSRALLAAPFADLDQSSVLAGVEEQVKRCADQVLYSLATFRQGRAGKMQYIVTEENTVS